MAPLVRRTWGPRGNTPLLSQRTRSHKKVSAIAALCVSPERKRVKLYFRLLLGQNFNALNVRAFLYQLNKQLKNSAVIVWDRFLPHRAKKIRHFVQKTPGIHVCFLPPYAPELNPVEYLWSWLKHKPLANFTPDDLQELAYEARKGSWRVQHKQDLLRSFVNHSPLSLCLK
jgi:transposase